MTGETKACDITTCEFCDQFGILNLETHHQKSLPLLDCRYDFPCCVAVCAVSERGRRFGCRCSQISNQLTSRSNFASSCCLLQARNGARRSQSIANWWRQWAAIYCSNAGSMGDSPKQSDGLCTARTRQHAKKLALRGIGEFCRPLVLTSGPFLLHHTLQPGGCIRCGMSLRALLAEQRER